MSGSSALSRSGLNEVLATLWESMGLPLWVQKISP